ncbi:MAG: hypothetical protein R6V77_08420 [Candidatus Cloacimonadaceae bacterium]
MSKKYLCCLVLLLISVMLAWNLPARSVLNMGFQDRFRIITLADSLESGFLADLYKSRVQTENPLFLVTMNVSMVIPLSAFEYKGPGSDMIEMSGSFFKKYFAQKITVFNFYDLGFVYLSVIDAQSSQGFIQFMIPFGNLQYIINPKKWKK